jgi:hypothetical protein
MDRSAARKCRTRVANHPWRRERKNLRDVVHGITPLALLSDILASAPTSAEGVTSGAQNCSCSRPHVGGSPVRTNSRRSGHPRIKGEPRHFVQKRHWIFEHLSRVTGNQTLAVRFTGDQLDDVLKSFDRRRSR